MANDGGNRTVKQKVKGQWLEEELSGGVGGCTCFDASKTRYDLFSGKKQQKSKTTTNMKLFLKS